MSEARFIPLSDVGLPSQESRLPFTSILVGIFVLGAVTVSAMEGWNYLVKALGVLLAAAYLISSVRSRLLPSGEMILYLIWVTWSLTGVFVARSGVLFWLMWTTVFQMWVLIVVIAGFTNTRRAALPRTEPRIWAKGFSAINRRRLATSKKCLL